MLPADWEVYLRNLEAEQRHRPETAPKKPTGIKSHMSARQRRAFSQTSNLFKAGFTEENDRNRTPTRRSTDGLTLNVGGSCEPDQPHGKATNSRN